MTPEDLRSILSQSEGLKLDFKQEYTLSKTSPSNINKQDWARFVNEQRDESIKEIVAVTNGNVGTAGQPGRLIIGADNQLSPDGTRQIYDMSNLHLTAQQILASVNNACNPPIPDLRCEQVLLDGKQVWI